MRIEQYFTEKAGEESDQQYVLFPMWCSGSTNPQNTDEDAAFDGKDPEFDEKKPESEVIISPSSSAQSKKQDDKTKREAKGKKLEDITYSEDEDDVGAETDFNNLETSITVSPIPKIRVHKDHHVTQIIGDLSLATQTRSMTRVAKDQGGLSQMFNDDLHTCMFACFLSQEEPKRVHQALKDPSWIEAMEEELLQFKMQKVWVLVNLPYGKRAIGTRWVFRNKKDERGIVVRNKARLVAQGHTHEEGLTMKKSLLQLKKSMFVNLQSLRTLIILKKFTKWSRHFMVYIKLLELDGKSASTPIDTEKPLLKDPDGEDVDYLKVVLSGMESLKRMLHVTNILSAGYLTTQQMVLNSPCLTHIKNWLVQIKRSLSWLVQKQTTLGVNTPRCDVDRLELMELTVFLLPKVEQVGIRVSAVDLQVSAVRLMLLLYVSCIKQFWTTVAVKKVNDVIRLQALVDKKKVVVTEATIREALCLDDAEGVECLPNEEIFAQLARIGYEKPSTKLKFYKAFFSSQWKFLIHTILQCISAKRTSWNEFSSSMAFAVICLSSVGDLSTHTTKYTSPALTQKVFANIRRVRKRFLRVETPLFEGMLVAQEIAEEGDAEVHGEEVNSGDAAKGDVSAANDEILTVTEEPSIASPTPPTPPPQPSHDISSTSQAQPTPPQSPQVQPPLPQPQAQPQPQPQPTQGTGLPMNLLQEVMVEKRLKKLERRNKVRVLKLRRLQKVGTIQRVKTSDETVMDDVSNQGRMIAKMDQNADVVLEEAKEVAEDAKEDESEPAEVQEVVDVVTTAKIITKVVTATSETITAASTTITSAEAQVLAATLIAAPLRVTAAPRRRTKGVVIRDPQEESTTSTIIPAETKSKDKGKEILVEEPKPLKRQAQIEQDEQYARELEAELNKTIDWDKAIDHVKKKAKEDPDVKIYQVLKRKPQTEAQARKNMMVYLNNVAGFKMDYFKGMSYDDIRPIFEAKFNINVAFLQKIKEQIEEEESRALKKLNETPTGKAAKRQKLDEEVEELKRHLQIVPNKDDDVYTEATPLARKDLEALWSLVKERFSTTKPKNFSDDFLLVTLGAMFEKPDILVQIWKNQRSVHGPAKVKGWKLLESCGVQIITFTTTQLILLVERKYPLTRFTLDQMLNVERLILVQIWKNQRSVHGPAKVKGWKLLESCGVQIITFTTTQLILLVERKYPLTRFTLDQMLNVERLKVEEESEVSLELLSFGVDAAKEFKEKRAKCLMLLMKDLVLPSQVNVD
uniref:Reverse transcriptase Ty1/copia-type domain-containing protein n=1 Tax=Tanacetum cinerariifolium TaxID=118510 RepID=A0A6L2J5J0_TANCI|nr:hypothetical protein [Tanacetum cinerariifolium]